MAPTSRRTTRSARARTARKDQGGAGFFGDVSGGMGFELGFGGSHGPKPSKPARSWVSVNRPPAPGVGFLVQSWVPLDRLTPQEQLKYAPPKLEARSAAVDNSIVEDSRNDDIVVKSEETTTLTQSVTFEPEPLSTPMLDMATVEKEQLNFTKNDQIEIKAPVTTAAPTPDATDAATATTTTATPSDDTAIDRQATTFDPVTEQDGLFPVVGHVGLDDASAAKTPWAAGDAPQPSDFNIPLPTDPALADQEPAAKRQRVEFELGNAEDSVHSRQDLDIGDIRDQFIGE